MEWPTLTQLVAELGDSISFVAHVFPLPYHHNAFYAAQAGLFISQTVGQEAWFNYTNTIFQNQNQLLDNATIGLSPANIWGLIGEYAVQAAPSVNLNDLLAALEPVSQNP